MILHRDLPSLVIFLINRLIIYFSSTISSKHSAGRNRLESSNCNSSGWYGKTLGLHPNSGINNWLYSTEVIGSVKWLSCYLIVFHCSHTSAAMRLDLFPHAMYAELHVKTCRRRITNPNGYCGIDCVRGNEEDRTCVCKL